jgi:hypothetical protein
MLVAGIYSYDQQIKNVVDQLQLQTHGPHLDTKLVLPGGKTNVAHHSRFFTITVTVLMTLMFVHTTSFSMI